MIRLHLALKFGARHLVWGYDITGFGDMAFLHGSYVCKACYGNIMELLTHSRRLIEKGATLMSHSQIDNIAQSSSLIFSTHGSTIGVTKQTSVSLVEPTTRRHQKSSATLIQECHFNKAAFRPECVIDWSKIHSSCLSNDFP